VGAEVAKCSDAALASVSHPSPVGIEPAAEGSVMAHAGADPSDGSEVSGVDQLFHGLHFFAAALEVSSLENDFVGFEGLEEGGRDFGAGAERFLEEHGLARFGDGVEEFEVVDGLAGDDEGIDGFVGGHLGEGAHLSTELFGVLSGFGSISVVDAGAEVFALEDFAGESGGVNVGDANPGEIERCGHFASLQSGRGQGRWRGKKIDRMSKS